MKTLRIIALLTLFAAVISSNNSTAQESTMFFGMRTPQLAAVNPALHPDCKVFVELPVISSFKLAFSHSGFSYADLEAGLKDSVNFDYFAALLDEENTISFENDISLLGFGFKVDDMFFSLNISNRTDMFFTYPNDIIDLRNISKNYVGANNPYQLGGISMDIMNYNEIALGFSKPVNEKIIVGARLKYLMGGTNIHLAKSGMTIYNIPDPTNQFVEEISVDVNMELSATYPMKVYLDDQQMLDSLEMGNVSDDLLGNLVFNDNRGFGFDLGITYHPNSQLIIAASIVDLGKMNWKTNPNVFKSTGERFDWKGFDISPNNNTDIETIGENLADSLKNILKLKHSSEAYKTGLNPKLNLGVNYQISEKFGIGAFSRLKFTEEAIHTTFTVAANTKVGKWFSLVASYSVMSPNINSLGLGLVIKGGPIQLYLMSDNIVGAIVPKQVRSADVRMGLNLLFGKAEEVNESFMNEE